MKKIANWLAILIVPTMLLTLSSCQKEQQVVNSTDSEAAVAKASHVPQTRGYNAKFEMWLKFKPNIPGGWIPSEPNSLAWWPGYGSGNATHMGNVSVYFNQYTVRQPSGGIYMFSAPAIMFFGTELQAYNVPSSVTSVVYDDKGNSVWFQDDPAGIPTKTVSETLITFSGKMYIVGGTGKFAGATGEVSLDGDFDPSPLATNPNALLKGAFWNKGWIRY